MSSRLRSHFALVGAAVLLVAARGAAAQVRDNRPRIVSPTVASGSVSGGSGILIDGLLAPVRRARVVLLPSTGDPLLAQTDTDGRFAFARLVDGDYRISVEKVGFVMLSPPTVVTVRRGQAPPFVAVLMGRGAAISGRVVDARGDPFKGVLVAVDRVGPSGDRTRSEYSATSNILGNYRIHSLPAGDYLIHARAEEGQDDLYYPGAPRVDDARVLRVVPGEDVEPIDFSLATVPRDAPSFQSIQLAPASRGFASPIGTGHLSGRVTRQADGTFVPNALVRQAFVTTGEGSAIRADEQGRFEFTGLADGEYALTAQAPEFASAHTGAFQSFAGARLVPLKDGRSAEDITLVVPQVMTIEGRVLDEFGDPVPDVRPRLALRLYGHGQAQLVPFADSGLTTATDDLGRFRFSQVAAGDYYLEVMFRPFFDATDHPVGFAPTYFPGTDQDAEARPIHLQEGVDVRDLVLSLIPANTTSIDGRVIEASGQPVPKPRVQLLRMQAGVVTTTAMAEGGTDGLFAIDDVPPGAYVVDVQTLDESGTVSLLYSGSPGESVPPFTIVMQKPLQIDGHVVFDDMPGHPPPSGLRILAVATDIPVLGQGAAAPVRADGTFTLSVRGGPGLIRMAMPVPGWVVEAVRLNGEDVTDTPFDLQRAVREGLEVVVTSRVGSIAGRLVDEPNVVPDALIGVVPEDRSKWTSSGGLPLPVRANLQGRFDIKNLRPGRYLAFAFQGIVSELDPAVIESHLALAMPVTVVEGQEALVELTWRKR